MSPSPDGRRLAYLAGAMERAPDRGRAWRARLGPVFETLGHACFNPCVEEATLLSDEERAGFRDWKAAGDARFVPLMRRIIGFDLAALARADYVVCLWDEYAQWSGGTPAEVSFAYQWGLPVYLVLAMPRVEVSSWVQGCASRTFDDLGELERFLLAEYGGA
ncbi:MAG: hypothetical protein ABR559_06230 [Gemmatimonadota bacterium]